MAEITPARAHRRNSTVTKDGIEKPGILQQYLGQQGEIYSWTRDRNNPWSETPFPLAMIRLLNGELVTFGVMEGEEVDIGTKVEVVAGRKPEIAWQNDTGNIQYVPKVREII